jgi:hypothetical protein
MDSRLSEATMWLLHFSEFRTDHLPHNNQLHFPRSYSKPFIFENYCNAMETDGLQPVTYSYFLQMWKKDFPHVVCSQVWLDLSFSNFTDLFYLQRDVFIPKCTFCEELQLALRGDRNPSMEASP